MKEPNEPLVPDCCKNCVSLTENGACHADNKRCERWRLWFHKEWTSIILSAERIKEKRKRRLSKWLSNKS